MGFKLTSIIKLFSFQRKKQANQVQRKYKRFGKPRQELFFETHEERVQAALNEQKIYENMVESMTRQIETKPDQTYLGYYFVSQYERLDEDYETDDMTGTENFKRDIRICEPFAISENNSLFNGSTGTSLKNQIVY